MKKIHWGIVATGTIARKFAGTMRQLGDCGEIAAVASRREEKARDFAAEFLIPRAYGSYQALAADPDVDAVYIATPHSSHFDDVRLCLENGKHVLCEKSFTVNAVQARELVRLARQNRCFLMEAFWTRFLPAYQQVTKILRDGLVGDVTHFRAQYGFAPTGARYARKFDPSLAGGALLDIGVYCIGVAMMILDRRPQHVHSCAVIGEYGTDRFDSIMLEYANGVSAHLVATIGTKLEQQAVVVGTKGHIVLPEFSALQRIELYTDDGETQTIEVPFEINGFEYQIREAERCIRNGAVESRIMSHEESVSGMELMDRIRGQWGLRFPCE